MEELERRVIDNRRKEKFMVDDEYLNGQAKLCGWQGTIVYNSLCRHANKSQESFPSIALMAEQHGVSRPTIMKGIDNLERRKVIQVKKKRTKDGKWLNNTYILTDKSEWDYSQVNDVYTDSQVNVVYTPSQRGLPDGVNDVYTKETHSEGNTSKETHLSCEQGSRNKEIISILEKFKQINPAIQYGNTTQRKACDELIAKFGIEEALKMVEMALQAQLNDRYCPRATTPHIFWQKIGDFMVYFKGKSNFNNIVSV